MLALTEDDNPIYVNPAYIIIVRPRASGGSTLTVDTGKIALSVLVDQNAEDIAASMTQMMTGTEHRDELGEEDMVECEACPQGLDPRDEIQCAQCLLRFCNTHRVTHDCTGLPANGKDPYAT